MFGFILSKFIMIVYTAMTIGYYLAQMMLFSVLFVPLYLYAQLGATYYRIRYKPCRQI